MLAKAMNKSAGFHFSKNITMARLLTIIFFGWLTIKDWQPTIVVESAPRSTCSGRRSGAGGTLERFTGAD